MPQLFVEATPEPRGTSDPERATGGAEGVRRWEVVALDGTAAFPMKDHDPALRLQGVTSAGGAPALGTDATPLAPVVRRSADVAGREAWVALDAPGGRLLVNGTPLVTGIRLLRHRDELRLEGEPGRVFFSNERLARVVPFTGAQAVVCPRCKLEIEPGTPAVACPQCGVHYHEDPANGLPCWTHAETCQLDSQATDLDAGFRWTPAEVTGHD